MVAGEQGWDWKVLAAGSKAKPLSLDRGRPSLASAWLPGPAFPKAQREGCFATKLKEKKLFGQCVQSTVLEKTPERKGVDSGARMLLQAFCQEPGILSQSQGGVREDFELCFSDRLPC